MKNEIDITVELRVHISRKYRTQTKAAEAWGCSPAFVSAVLSGKKPPTEIMLYDSGFERLPAKSVYRKKVAQKEVAQ